MATKTTLPPMPLASITEGSRILHSRAQMREFGVVCHDLGYARGYQAGIRDAAREASPTGIPGKTPGEVPDFFASIFGASP